MIVGVPAEFRTGNLKNINRSTIVSNDFEKRLRKRLLPVGENSGIIPNHQFGFM
jgi:hypothetical protein